MTRILFFAGFFLMLEAGLIDYGHHANFAKKAFEEALELEKAVLKALELTKGTYINGILISRNSNILK